MSERASLFERGGGGEPRLSPLPSDRGACRLPAACRHETSPCPKSRAALAPRPKFTRPRRGATNTDARAHLPYRVGRRQSSMVPGRLGGGKTKKKPPPPKKNLQHLTRWGDRTPGGKRGGGGGRSRAAAESSQGSEPASRRGTPSLQPVGRNATSPGSAPASLGAARGAHGRPGQSLSFAQRYPPLRRRKLPDGGFIPGEPPGTICPAPCAPPRHRQRLRERERRRPGGGALFPGPGWAPPPRCRFNPFQDVRVLLPAHSRTGRPRSLARQPQARRPRPPPRPRASPHPLGVIASGPGGVDFCGFSLERKGEGSAGKECY